MGNGVDFFSRDEKGRRHYLRFQTSHSGKIRCFIH